MNFSNPKDALEWATIISKTRFCPKDFWDRPHDVLIAIAYGSELGLKPLQALQNICVINGKPSIWGDAMLAVCKNHPDFEWIKETNDGAGACCVVKRKGQPECCNVFNQDDAVRAKLWNKPGPWQQYPLRMLQMRARSFALRDCFPDVLKGLIGAEEAQDIPPPKDVVNLQQELDVVMEQQTIEDLTLTDKLITLVNEKNIPVETIDKWLSKANVKFMSELPQDIKQKLINHLEQMETPNGSEDL